MTSTRARLIQLMRELDIQPKKSLGQNFLVSDHVVNKIIQAAEKLKPAAIIEIGPGLGSITTGLIPIAKEFCLLELDAAFAHYWRQQKLHVIETDALQWDWNLSQFARPVVLVSNLPYQISSSLVVDRSLDTLPLDAMILMFQKEVAQRLKATASQSTYGFLSVIAQTFWNLELVLEAGPPDFLPPPKVASRVLKFSSRTTPISSKKDYLKFLKAAFLHPRKYLASNLAHGLNLDKEMINQLFAKLDWSHQRRPQELKIQEYLDLYAALGYK